MRLGNQKLTLLPEPERAEPSAASGTSGTVYEPQMHRARLVLSCVEILDEHLAPSLLEGVYIYDLLQLPGRNIVVKGGFAYHSRMFRRSSMTMTILS